MNGTYMLNRKYHLFEQCITTENVETNLSFISQIPSKKEVRAHSYAECDPVYGEYEGVQILFLSYFKDKRISCLGWV